MYKIKIFISLTITAFIGLGVYLFTGVVGVAAIPTDLPRDDIRYKIVEVALENAGIVDPELNVVFTDDLRYNCGAHGTTGLGGCFRFNHPDTIYLSTDLKADQLRFIALHEYAHVLQFRNGEPLDECAADKQAIEWGGKENLAAYKCE